MTSIPHKRCSKCGADKPLTEFHQDKHTIDGFTHACRLCRRVTTKHWQAENAEHRASYGAQWREERREYDKQRKAAWYQLQPERQRERARRWRKNNPDKRRAQIRAYYKAKPDKIRTIAQRRRSRQYQQGGSYNEQEWMALKARYDYTCLRCGRCEPDISLTADHVIPIARGGSSFISNIQPLCMPCNQWKSIRTFDFRNWPMPSARVIMPKGPVFKAAAAQRVVSNTLTAIAKDMKIDFDVTTQTWEHRPRSTIEQKGEYERVVKVEGEVYAMLDAGTSPHMIRPRRARVLAFRSPFRAKTLPNQIMSRAGSQGTTTVYSRGVHHPGTKPRNWAKTIAKKWQKQAPIIMQRAIDAEYT